MVSLNLNREWQLSTVLLTLRQTSACRKSEFSQATDWTSDRQIQVASSSEGDSLNIQVPPGGIAVIEIRVKP
jgi:hypothetical protein